MSRSHPLFALAATALGAVGCFPSLPPEAPDASADGQIADGAEALDGAGDAETTPDAAPDTTPDAAAVDVSRPDCSELDGPCATGSWSAELGRCVALVKDDDTACDDDDACTLETVCRAGQCVGTAKECPPADACHLAGRCEPATGECLPVVGPDGVACELDDPCAAEAECRAGVCTMTVAAVDEDDWVVPLPAGFEVGFVAAGEEAPDSFVFAGLGFGQVSFGSEITLGPDLFTALIQASPRGFSRTASQQGPFTSGNYQRSWRPWWSTAGAVVGAVATSISGADAVFGAMNDEWMTDERVAADSVYRVVAVDARHERYAVIIEHQGCLSWTDIIYTPSPEPQVQTFCPSSPDRRTVSVGFGDMSQFLFHEAGLPMTAYREIFSLPESTQNPATVREARMLPGGAMLLAVEFTGALALPAIGADFATQGGADCAVVYLNREGAPVWANRVGGALDDRCGLLSVANSGSFGIAIETQSPTLSISGATSYEVPRQGGGVEAGGIVVFTFDLTGQVLDAMRVHALDAGKGDARLAGFDLHDTRGARLLVAIENGQRVSAGTLNAPIVSAELGLVWIEFPAGEEAPVVALVDEIVEPSRFETAEAYVATRRNALFAGDGVGSLFQPLSGGWRVVNTQDRLRCRQRVAPR